jgi:hypothetical protein
MDTLEINVKGWPDIYVKLLKKYAEELHHDLGRKDLPQIPGEDRQRLVEHGVLHPGTQKLPDELCVPPVGDTPSGVLEALLDERARGR